MTKRINLTIIISVTIILLSMTSCRSLRPSEMFIVDEDYPISEFEQTSSKEYQIKPFDKLAMRITTNDGFSLIGLGDQKNQISGNNPERQRGLIYLVEFDGKLKLPVVGRVSIAGLTIREAEAFLEEQYAKYYQEPFVLIEVTNRKVIVFKDGGTQGIVLTIPSENLTLIEALAQSGGITDISKSYQIKLIRKDSNGVQKVYLFDVSHLKNLQESNILLEANDIIYIESKPKYFKRVMTEVAPYISLFTLGLTVYGLFIKP